MSSKHSGKSKASTPGKNKKIVDIFEEFRPPSGIRYDLDQTEANLKAGYTKIKLQHTTVEYEPGQNLSPSYNKIRYARQENRGPVWIFKEEIEKRRKERMAEHIAEVTMEKIKQAKLYNNKIEASVHAEMMSLMGPKWFHELGPIQINNAETLCIALKQDRKYKCIQHTVDKLIGIGLVLLPNHTKIEYCVQKFHGCPTEFLFKIFQLTHDSNKKDVYTLNDRLLLSCITHLEMRNTLRELHLRIPSPPREQIVKKRRKFSFEIQLRKQRKMKFKSPYVKPTIFIPQLHKHEVYMNRHKEYASSEYFNYVDDMYIITYEEVIKKKTKGLGLENSKYNKPPKIKVRQMQSKIERKKVYKLKKPSPYVSPCEVIFKEPEPEPEPEPPVDPNMCNCTPSAFNKDTTFDLEIKITTSREVMTFSQKICPYDHNCLDELKLKDHSVIDPEKTDEPCPSSGFKKIEYTCECNVCHKPVNILTDNLNTFSVYNNQPQNVSSSGAEAPKPTPNIERIDLTKCKCPSLDSDDPCADKGDTCDCTSKTEECTCCICAQNEDFLTKLKHYNELYNTNVKPCLCACKCKKHRRNPCCLTPLEAEQRKCKYCFCNKIKRWPDVPMPGDDDDNNEDDAALSHELDVIPNVPDNTESTTEATKKKKVDPKKGKSPLTDTTKQQEADAKQKEIEAKQKGTNAKTKDTNAKTKDTNAKTKDTNAKTKDTNTKTKDTNTKTKDTDTKTKDTNTKTKDTSTKTKDTNTKTKDTNTKTKDTNTKTKDTNTKQKESAKNTKDKKAAELFNVTDSVHSDESVCEECKCAKMYDDYLLTHDSCLDLFVEYQNQMKKDLEDYLKDLEERCICGDSLSNIEEEEIEDESICSCLKATKKPEYKSSSSEDNKCNCEDDSVKLNKCQCSTRKLTATPTCDYGRGQVDYDTDKMAEPEGTDVTNSTQVITDDTTKKSSNIKSSGTSQKTTSVSEENSRIFSLKKLPRTRRGQLRLLKKVLASLAEDGYPLAQLPDLHLLPIFKLWFDKRNNKFITMEQRVDYNRQTIEYLHHIYKCRRIINLPQLKWKTHEELHALKWDKVYTYQKYVYGIRNDFIRKFKRALVSLGQENFPSHFTYEFPNKTFRDCYFAYMPGNENNAFVFKPWQLHEVKKRQN